MKPKRKLRGSSAPPAKAPGAGAKASPKGDASAAVFYPREAADRPRAPEGRGSVVRYPR
jgi:hypothetical protein